ncbi:MAG: hypothetical protein H7Y00_11460 [Fimbriimonadaceae bacterium]|nr:hypothetical protein [Chitinophagales bacterium]
MRRHTNSRIRIYIHGMIQVISLAKELYFLFPSFFSSALRYEQLSGFITDQNTGYVIYESCKGKYDLNKEELMRFK